MDTYQLVYYCSIFADGDELYKKNVKLINEVHPKITEIPAVTFNGVLQMQAVKYFESAVCQFLLELNVLPELCK